MAVEEIAKVCASSALILMVQELGTLPIQLFGTDEQKDRILPRCASGEWSPAFALSEPEAGSDPSAMRTRAVRDGDEWVLNGTKNWISNSGIADFYVVFAVTDPEQRGASAFIVERDRPGFSIGGLEHKLGIKGSPTGSPGSRRRAGSGREPDRRSGQGNEHRVFHPGTNETRCGGPGGRDRAGGDRLRHRLREGARAFGRPIIELQGLQFKLADMQTRTAAARELLYKACAMADRGDPKLAMYSSMAKLFASDTAMSVTIEAVQVLGGYGYVTEYPVERMMRDAKITQIYEGTNEIQRVVIARHLQGSSGSG